MPPSIPSPPSSETYSEYTGSNRLTEIDCEVQDAATIDLTPETPIPAIDDTARAQMEHLTSIITTPESDETLEGDSTIVPELRKASTAVVEALKDAKHSIEPYLEKRSIFLVFGKVTRLRKEAKSSIQLFSAMSKIVRNPAVFLTSNEKELSVLFLMLMSVLIMETRQLVQTCRKHKGDADKLVDALQNFQQNFRSILALDRPLERISRLELDEAKLCPLEAILIRSDRVKHDSYPLRDFCVRILSVDLKGATFSSSFTVKSIHLYRSRKAPFHHEFTLLCLLDPSLSESWMRVERAARMKASPLTPTRDSLGPLFRGVPSRDTVSFATTKLELCTNADELACIITAPTPANLRDGDLSDYMNLPALFMQLLGAFSADPDYQLFKTNCRWFARRCTLSIAQRLSAAGAVGTVHWEGCPSSIESLMTNLLGDRFGGRQMAGPRGVEIFSSTLLQLAATARLSNEFSKAEKYSQDALNHLQGISSPTATQRHLIGRCLLNLGMEYNRCGEPGRALEHLQKSRGIYHDVQPTGKPFDDEIEKEYAKALFNLGRVEESVAVWDMLIPQVRGGEVLNDILKDLNKFLLHGYLASYASALENIPERLNDALSAVEEGVEIVRRLYEINEARFANDLANDLSIWASILRKLGRQDEAYNKLAESLAITRRALEQSQGAYLNDMHHRVLAFATAAEELGRSDEGSDAIGDLIDFWQPVCEKTPDQLLAFSNLLMRWGFYLERNGRSEEALEKLMAGLEYERSVNANRPNKVDADDKLDWDAMLVSFAGHLNEVAVLLWEHSHPRAIEISDEAVSYSTLVCESQPKEGGLALASVLYIQALRNLSFIVDGDSVPVGLIQKGRDWVQEAVNRLKDVENVDTDVTLSNKFGDALIVLSHYDRLLEQFIPALHSASFAFKVYGSHFDPNVSESAAKMTTAVALWVQNILSLGSHAEYWENSIHYVQDMVARWIYCVTACPDASPQTELYQILRSFATVIIGVLQLRREAHILFLEVIRIGRLLFAAEDTHQREAAGVELEETLLLYYNFLTSDSGLGPVELKDAADVIFEEMEGLRGQLSQESQAVEATSASIEAGQNCSAGTDTDILAHRPLLSKMLNGLATQTPNSGNAEVRFYIYLTTKCGQGYEIDPTVYPSDLCRAMHCRAGSLQELGRSLEAIELSHIVIRLAREDLEISSNIDTMQFLAEVLDTTAQYYDSMKGFEEALKLSEETILLWRELPGGSLSRAMNLSASLQSHSYRLLQVGGHRGKESLSLIEQAVELERDIYFSDATQYRERLTRTLLHYARLAQQLSLPIIAIAASKEALDLVRLGFENDEETNCKLFAHQLMEHAKLMDRLDYLDDAFGAVEEALPLWRRLDHEDSQKYRRHLVEGLQCRFDLASKLKSVTEQLASLAEQLQLINEAISWGAQEYESIFLGNSNVFRSILDAVKDDFPQYNDVTFLAEARVDTYM